MSQIDPVIREFMQHYLLKYDFYSQLAKMVEERLRVELDKQGIRAIVTSRAKDPDRLQAKLVQRRTRVKNPKNYRTQEDVEADIVDFSGARVALYFPGDIEKVSTLIDSVFDRLDLKKFPEASPRVRAKGLAGYIAQHHRVRLKGLSPAQQRYATGRVEIQVASVLMHAWSEVEHDLQYKPLSGKLSLDEEATLDELNGLVLTGEIALERLQRSLLSRSSSAGFRFETTYDLQDHLSQSIPDARSNGVGRLNYLLSLLKFSGLDRPEALKKYMDEVDGSTDGPVADKLIDLIIQEDPDKARFLEDAILTSLDSDRAPFKESDVYQTALGHFLTTWIRLEKSLRGPSGDHVPIFSLRADESLRKMGLAEEDISQYYRIRKIRNGLVHGQIAFTSAELRDASKDVLALIKLVEAKNKIERSPKKARLRK
ncbi:hypothetical protein Terro_0447 [Terriglobus roseus DSM 18391]|uniref:RelA/SpoT domain-containing protein n=1 Tax=Terriglobus roseus (strain DSM 18391 / NRRL B-41598 / KBS 63) TaxID=926566 RepID=I3ZC22_TERRK|nr:RelA/SpoT domain-containing protein [Terriglobus roseus]AFL86790.1 hypothetical protein Terro_0447 [Terriglobus roseus DSM 18391]